MVDQLTLQTIGILLTGLTVSIAAIYYTLTLRYTRRNQELALKAQEQALETRQAQMFLQMLNRWRDEVQGLDVWSVISNKLENAEDYLEKNQSDDDFRRVVSAFIGFYEGLGVIVKEGYLSIRLVALMWAGMTRTFWENILEDTVDDLRVHFGLPRFLSETEYVCRELMKYIEEHPELKT